MLLKKLLFKTVIMFLKKMYFGIIGNMGIDRENKAKEVAESISSFILQMTGNEVIHKDSVPSNCSIIELNGGAPWLMKKIMKLVEIEPQLYQLADFLPNMELIIGILSTVYPHDERGKMNFYKFESLLVKLRSFLYKSISKW